MKTCLYTDDVVYWRITWPYIYTPNTNRDLGG